MNKAMQKKNAWNSDPQPKKINDDLRICWDADSNPEDPKDRHVIIWGHHNKNWNEKDYPYDLSIKQAKKLRDWLDSFLFEVGAY